jgi:hypothetical protein
MKLKVGDFLICKEGDVTYIAAVTVHWIKMDNYDLTAISSTGSVDGIEGVYDWQLEEWGWTKLEV